MSSESLEELKQIVNNAPSTATHVDDNKVYSVFVQNKDLCYYESLQKNGTLNRVRNMRSLSDIKRIVELMEQVKASYEAYSRIEAIKQKYNAENKQLKKICIDNGICVKCGTHWEHHLDEPFASCSCGTGEDTKLGSPYMQLQKKCYDLYLENNKLKERLGKYE